MADRVKVGWRGKEYQVERKDGRAAAPESGPIWQVTHEGAPVTSFPADPADGPGTVHEKVVAWLEANASRPAMDVGRQ
jgi:hypothetical protein